MSSFNWGAAAGSLLGGIGSSLGSSGWGTALSTLGNTLSAGFATSVAPAAAAATPAAATPVGDTAMSSLMAGGPTIQATPVSLTIPQNIPLGRPADLTSGLAGAAAVPISSGGGALATAGKYVEMARRAKRAWDTWSSSPFATEVQDIDLLTLSQADDLQAAKLAVKHGVIPAWSDLGTALQMAGAKVVKRRVRFSDGTVQTVEVIETKGSRKRRRRNYATKAGIRNAGRTLRQMGQMVRTYRRLASLGARIDRSLHPKRAAAKRTTTRRRRAA